MAARYVGYEFLREQLGLGSLPSPPLARVDSVTRVSPFGDEILAIPAGVAPAGNDPLAHLLFALKHEGTNLATALLALRHVSEGEITQALETTPSGQYVRIAAFLWEIANQRQLAGEVSGPYVPVFDPERYITGRAMRSQRWRVDFNGLGSPAYCATVRRTPEIERLLALDILGRAQAFAQSIPQQLLDRAVRWAMLSETDSSFDIERETPSHDKREAFANLLAKAHSPEPLTEDYLTHLQNLTVTNPYDHAPGYRGSQNWLRGERRVTYFPPPPDLAGDLMAELEAAVNDPDQTVDPLIRAAVASFGFVFVHPFTDGNGRLSRFLFHKVICQDPRLATGLVLPVSIAMKRHEDQYLAALTGFSRPTLDLWDWTDIDMDVRATFRGPPEVYRYWDATPCVEFGLRMALEALERDLQSETDFLQTYDRVYRAVNEAVDLNSNDLGLVIRGVMLNGGTLSRNLHKKLVSKGHPEALIEAAGEIAAEAYRQGLDEDDAPPPEEPAPRG